MARQAEEIRQYVLVTAVAPARRRGRRTVRVRAGDVHRGMGLQNRMPAACAALDAAVFARSAGVMLTSREGPPRGATAAWLFEL